MIGYCITLKVVIRNPRHYLGKCINVSVMMGSSLYTITHQNSSFFLLGGSWWWETVTEQVRLLRVGWREECHYIFITSRNISIKSYRCDSCRCTDPTFSRSLDIKYKNKLIFATISGFQEMCVCVRVCVIECECLYLCMCACMCVHGGGCMSQ